MYKSSKRLKLEKEIFSKSIKDIEQMFNLPYSDRWQEPLDRWTGRDEWEIPDTRKHKQANFDRLDLPVGSALEPNNLHYNCINMSLFLSDTCSEGHSAETVETPVLPSSTLLPGRVPAAPARHVLIGLHEDGEVEGYMFELDSKVYMPRVNLESDLKMIDQLFMAPVPAT